jgi:uracil-DNA glycosylase family 4
MADPGEPGRDCPLCPRLAGWRATLRQAHPDWHNAPVPSFGNPATAPVIVVGLAPGLNGANRTGRPFTGDYAGDLLYATLLRHGFARGDYRADPGDGLALVDLAIVNSVRCVPPENKPTPTEVATCRRFLVPALQHPPLRIVVALGRIAHDSAVRALGLRAAAVPFAHGAVHPFADGRTLRDSYHCSRYNTNTGRLTAAMFDAVFARVRADLDAGRG